jgi:Asp-tRNA(Asn)/Glu-tRNA(Gln) amidotransferase C subunit
MTPQRLCPVSHPSRASPGTPRTNSPSIQAGSLHSKQAIFLFAKVHLELMPGPANDIFACIRTSKVAMMRAPICHFCRSELIISLRLTRQKNLNWTRRVNVQRRSLATTRAVSQLPKSNSANSVDVDTILSKPTWSVRSLLSNTSIQANNTVTPTQLYHLLRLSALPLPETPAEEAEMLKTLHSQLQFVQDIQSVNTNCVEPLRSIRDETEQGMHDATIRLEDLEEALGKEVKFGYHQRPRRVRDCAVDTAGVEDWEPLKTASRTASQYYVVKSGKD